MATDYESLIPVAQAREMIAAAAAESAVLTLGHSITMPSGVERVPVLSVAPTAAFVSPVYGGRKPLSTIEWTAENLVAEEIALTAWIPDAFIDDSEFPVWDSVRTEVAGAIARTLDAAVLYGTGGAARRLDLLRPLRRPREAVLRLEFDPRSKAPERGRVNGTRPDSIRDLQGGHAPCSAP